MPRSSRAPWCAVTDELYIGPTVLAPGPRTPWGAMIARLIIWPLLATFVIVVIVFYALFTSVRVDGESMIPALQHGDRVLVTKSYEQPRRGDVVVVDIGADGAHDRILKRLVALPGDVVRIDDDLATVNGVAEDGSRVVRVAGAGETRAEMQVPEGRGIILGDNRAISLDSRFIGSVPLQRVEAKVAFIFWPPERFGPVR